MTNTDLIRQVYNLRPTGLDPLTLITADIKYPDNPGDPIKGNYYFTPDAKVLWFLQWCIENNLTPKIVAQFVGSTFLDSVADSSVEGNSANLFQEHWRASVFVNGEMVSEADATGIVKLNSWEDRKYTSNQTRKYAIGAALSLYGFGAVSTFPMTEEEINDALKASGNPVPANPNAPVTSPASAQFVQNMAPVMGANPVPAASLAAVPVNQGHMMQDSFFGSNILPEAGTAGTIPPAYRPPMTESQPATAPQVDPLDEAKKLVWPGKGKFAGKTLGEILSAPGAQKNLDYIVNEYNPRNADGQAFKDAAKLILNNCANGK